VNQELEIYFRIFCTNNPKIWKSLNLLMEFSHNQKVHSVTKQSPFYLMMEYKLKDIPLAFENTNTPAAEWRLKTLKEARNEASAAHELARQRMVERSTRGFTPFEKGQKVWLDGRNLKIGYESQKLAPKREGPFEITEIMGPITYHLKLPDQWRIHPVFQPLSYHPIKRPRLTAPTFRSLHLTLSKEKKSTKLKRSSHTENEGKVTNTL